MNRMPKISKFSIAVRLYSIETGIQTRNRVVLDFIDLHPLNG